MAAGAIALLLPFLLLGLTLLPLALEIRYRRVDGNDEFLLFLRFWRFSFVYLLPVLQLEKEKEGKVLRTREKFKLGPQEVLEKEKLTSFREFRRKVAEVQALTRRYRGIVDLLVILLRGRLRESFPLNWGYPWLGLFLGILEQGGRRVERFEWLVKAGLGDAAQTGIATGILWGLTASAFALLSKELHFVKTPRVAVEPDFRRRRFDIYFHCIFKISLGHIILASICNLTHYFWKKGVAALARAAN